MAACLYSHLAVLQSFAEEKSDMQARLVEQAHKLEELEASSKELRSSHAIALQVHTHSQTVQGAMPEHAVCLLKLVNA